MDIQTSHQLQDPAWDAFLDRIPRSHYIQSSMWAQVMAQSGWRCVRWTARENGAILAGFQMLLRSVPLLGSIGYIARGPVISSDDPSIIDLVLHHLLDVARSERVLLLKLQPPYEDDRLADILPDMGFLPSHAHADNVATLLIDLSKDEATLLGDMKKSLRKGIRKATRRGATVHQGTDDDVALFYRILQQTSERGGFAIHDEAYYRTVWECFASQGHAALFFVTCENEPVATVFVIGFGDSVFARFGGWNGKHSHCEPNSLLRWSAIQWAKQQGYRWYDFMGIDEGVACAMIQDQPLPDSGEIPGYTFFKLGFGGEIVLSPGTYDYVSHPLLARGYRWLHSNPDLYDRVLNIVRGVA